MAPVTSNDAIVAPSRVRTGTGDDVTTSAFHPVDELIATPSTPPGVTTGCSVTAKLALTCTATPGLRSSGMSRSRAPTRPMTLHSSSIGPSGDANITTAGGRVLAAWPTSATRIMPPVPGTVAVRWSCAW